MKSLLMGGQACIFYGAAEFSRDTDLVILADAANIERLRMALTDLQADVIAVPPFETQYLEHGHSIHFSCHREDVRGMRLDVMSKMRGVDPFPELWARRTSATIVGMGDLEIISLPDLVAAKKTQRDKDWPMVRRLVEANYFAFRDEPTPERIRFWLMELRTPGLLVEVARVHKSEASELSIQRRLISNAIVGDEQEVEAGLHSEESAEREADRAYWAPLRAELEKLRHAARLNVSLDDIA